MAERLVWKRKRRKTLGRVKGGIVRWLEGKRETGYGVGGGGVRRCDAGSFEGLDVGRAGRWGV